MGSPTPPGRPRYGPPRTESMGERWRGTSKQTCGRCAKWRTATCPQLRACGRPTGREWRAAANRVSDTLISHAVAMDPGWGGGPEGIRAFVAEQATRCMTLDPGKILTELDRVREVVKEVDPMRGSAGQDAFAESGRVLDCWTGNAAESFRRRLRDLKAFGQVQHERSVAFAKALAVLAALAAQTRNDFHTVAEHTIAAANQARATAKKEGVTFAIKVGGAFAKAAFGGFRPEDVGGAVTDIAVEGVSLHIGSGSFDEVMAGYQGAVHGVVMGLGPTVAEEKKAMQPMRARRSAITARLEREQG